MNLHGVTPVVSFLTCKLRLSGAHELEAPDFALTPAFTDGELSLT